MNGLVLIDKPEGMTSFTAASIMKRAFNTKRVGHTGTLDPLATGVLPVLIGRATRLTSFILESDKRYIATVRLGITTDTLDITGTVLSESKVCVTREELEKVLDSFLGEYMQMPPMYSAIRINGQRLYDLARKGEEAERSARLVKIKELQLLEFDGVNFKIDVTVSKGTYIRSLADDIGKKLGCGATMTALRRTKTAGFSIEDCTDPDIIKLDPEKYLLKPELAVPHLKNVFVTEKQAARFINGGELDVKRLTLPESDDKIFKVFSKTEFLGLGEINEDNSSLTVKCVIAER